MTAAPIIITADEINCLIYSYFQDSGFNHSAFALRNEGRLQNSPYFQKHIPRGELIDLLSKALLYLEVESHWRTDSLTTNCKAGFSLLDPHICSLEDPSEKSPPPPEANMETNGADKAPVSTGPRATNNSAAQIPAHATSQTKIPLPTRSGLPRPPPESAHAKDPMAPHEQPPHPAPAPNTPANADSNAKRKTSPVPIDGHVEKRARHMSADMDIDGASDSARSKSPATRDVSVYSQPDATKTPKIETRPQGPGDADTDPRVVLLLPGHKTEVFVCAFNPKMHNLLASGSKDGVVNVWNLPDPPLPSSSEFAEAPGDPVALENVSNFSQGDLTSLDWNSDGTLLAIGSYDSILRVCTNTGSLHFSHPQHQGPIFATRFSKNGAWLLTASLDGTTCLWDVKEKRLHKQYRFHKDCCLDVEWLSEDTFASAGADMRIFIMRVDEDDSIKTLIGHKDEINQIRVNPAGTRLASCSDDGTAYIWRVDNIGRGGENIPGLSASEHGVILKGHNHSVSTVGWCVDHPEGTNELLATSSFDGTARLWDSVTGECLHIFKDHKGPLYSLTFAPDGKFVATGSGDGWLHIYHTRTYERLWSWYAGSGKPGVFEIDWQEHDGINRIAMALECRQVAVVDVAKLDLVRTLQNGTIPTARIEDMSI